MEEIFKQARFIREDGSIEIYENYEVSNLGRIKSLGNDKAKKEKIMKPCTIDKYGHRVVLLRKNNKYYARSVHRFVLSTFNPEGYFEKAVVDHIDSNGGNNNLSNLRWVTMKENICTEHCRQAISKAHKERKHSEEVKRKISKALKGSNHPAARPCVYDGKSFNCMKEAYWYAQSQGYTKRYDAFRAMIKKKQSLNNI